MIALLASIVIRAFMPEICLVNEVAEMHIDYTCNTPHSLVFTMKDISPVIIEGQTYIPNENMRVTYSVNKPVNRTLYLNQPYTSVFLRISIV